MALIQINVPDDVKARADAAFARNGITTPAAMKMMVTQVAHENRTPFDGVFSSPAARELGEDIRRDMLLAEAQEYGLVADDATDARTIPDDVLGELGLTAQEVGQVNWSVKASPHFWRTALPLKEKSPTNSSRPSSDP